MTGIKTLELIDRELAELESEEAEFEAIAQPPTPTLRIHWLSLFLGIFLGAGVFAIGSFLWG